MRNPNPGYRRNTLPGLQIPAGLDAELEKILQAFKEHLELYTGSKGQPGERFVTLQDLKDAGIVDFADKRGRGEITRVSASERPSVTGGVAPSVSNLSDLGDVNASGRTDGNALVYSSSDNKWRPKALLTADGIVLEAHIPHAFENGVVFAEAVLAYAEIGDFVFTEAPDTDTSKFLRADSTWSDPVGLTDLAATSGPTYVVSDEHSETIPAETEEGDLILLVVMHRDDLDPITGFDLVLAGGPIGSSDHQLSVFKRQATDTDAETAINVVQATSEAMTAHVLVFRSRSSLALDVLSSDTITSVADELVDQPRLLAGELPYVSVLLATWETGDDTPPGHSVVAPEPYILTTPAEVEDNRLGAAWRHSVFTGGQAGGTGVQFGYDLNKANAIFASLVIGPAI